MCGAHKKQLDDMCAPHIIWIAGLDHMENDDEYSERGTTSECPSGYQGHRTRLEIRAGQRRALRLSRTGRWPPGHVPARLSRQCLVVSKAAAGLRGCRVSCRRAVPAWLCADRDSGGRHFRSDRTGQGSSSPHRGAERRRTGTRRRHGLGRHLDLSGASHGAIGVQGRRSHEHRTSNYNFEHQTGSGARSSRLPCLFLPASRRRIRGQYRGTSLRRLSLEAGVAALKYSGGLTDAGLARRLPINDMHTPTLTIYGSNDPTARYSVKEEPLFKGPHKRIVLPDVGHFPHLEREEEVTGLIMDWFKTHAPD